MNKLLDHAFVSTQSVEKEITLIDQTSGEDVKVTVYVKPLSFESATADIMGHRKALEGNEEVKPNKAIAARIAYSIRDKNGEPLFKESDIMGTEGRAITAALTMELLRVIGEVNNLGKKQA